MSEHVFISYARKDGEAHALRFDSELPQRGFKTWRDKRGIDPTQDFTAEIEKAIEAAAYVVTCITPDVRREDSFVRREIAYAQVVKKPIIVARFADVPPPIAVVNHTWLDFFKGWEIAFKQLCDLLTQPSGNYTPPPPSSDDPYKPYLDTLYKQIVRYLDKTVFSMLPGQSNTALITLRSEDTPDAVNAPEEIEAQALPLAFFDMAGVDDEANQSTTYNSFHEAFDKYEGRVLLLGEPGAGKTTTLFAFARDKVAQRLQDVTQPLPILAPIALWDAEKQPPLSEWLSQIVPALKNDASKMLSEGKTLLLLDGLDELGDERENKETKAKYDPRLRFMQVLPENNQILISCRIKDYNDIGAKLALKGAVTLHPLDDAQMQVYLKDMSDLWEVLSKDDELREVARTPLLLSFFTFAFAGLDEEAKQLKDLSKGDVRDKIFETYVRKRYEHEKRRSNKNISFTLDELNEILGEAAAGIIGGGQTQSTSFSTDFYFLRQFYGFKGKEILAKCVELHLITTTGEGRNDVTSFIHLLLRDYFAYHYVNRKITIDGNFDKQKLNFIYVLGRLRDERALPTLVSLFNHADTFQNKSQIMNAIFSLTHTSQNLEFKLGHPNYIFKKIIAIDDTKHFARVHDTINNRDLVVILAQSGNEYVEQEIEKLKTLDHPLFPKVYDISNINEIQYIAITDYTASLEYLQAPLSESQLIHIATSICDGLDYLHTLLPLPMIHCDIKPATITLDQDNIVHLMTSYATQYYQQGQKHLERGTEGYAPPEQYKGDIDPRSDLYALGATLHHIVTNKDPRLEAPHTFHERMPKTINPNISDKFEAVIMKALAFEREDRFQTALEMKEALLKCI